MNIINTIQGWREEEGLSYEELASRLGWSRQHLWRMLNMGTSPNFESVRKIAEALGHKMTILPLEDAPEEPDLTELYEAAEDQQVSFEVIRGIYRTAGYELIFD